MDRQYKKEDTVAVYNKAGTRVDTFRSQPYSRAGFDWYRYKGRVYPGYVDRSDDTLDAKIVLED